MTISVYNVPRLVSRLKKAHEPIRSPSSGDDKGRRPCGASAPSTWPSPAPGVARCARCSAARPPWRLWCCTAWLLGVLVAQDGARLRGGSRGTRASWRCKFCGGTRRVHRQHGAELGAPRASVAAQSEESEQDLGHVHVACPASRGAVSTHKPVLRASTGTRRRLLDSDGIGGLGEVSVPAPPGGWFDSDMVGACAVQRLRPDRWIMWYAGRSSHIQNDVVPIATGAIGVAISDDGLVWERACGPGAAGECFVRATARPVSHASHVGVGDVTRVGDQLAMLYFGGGSGCATWAAARCPGVGMCVGSATSMMA